MALPTSRRCRPSSPPLAGGVPASGSGDEPLSAEAAASSRAGGVMAAALSGGGVLGGVTAAPSGSGSGSGSGLPAGAPLLQPMINRQARHRRADGKGAMLLLPFQE